MSIFLNSTSLQMQYFDNNEASKVPNCWPVQNGEGWRHTWRRGKSNPAYKSFRAAFARVNLDFKPLAFKSLGPINRVRFVVQTSGGEFFQKRIFLTKYDLLANPGNENFPPGKSNSPAVPGKDRPVQGKIPHFPPGKSNPDEQ